MDTTSTYGKEFVPDDTNFEPYYVYVKYTEDGSEDDAFGTTPI